MNIDYLIARFVKSYIHLSIFYVYQRFFSRSLDINLDNEVERMHAIRLVRKLMQVNASKLPQSLVSVVVAIASGGAEEKDKLHKVCLSILCELGL